MSHEILLLSPAEWQHMQTERMVLLSRELKVATLRGTSPVSPVVDRPSVEEGSSFLWDLYHQRSEIPSSQTWRGRPLEWDLTSNVLSVPIANLFAGVYYKVFHFELAVDPQPEVS